VKKNDYFEKFCEIASLLLERSDIENSAVKSVIRFTLREAINHATDLPGHDNKKGAELVSKKAMGKIFCGDFDGLVGEHIVPVSVVSQRIKEQLPLTKSELASELKRFSQKAVITKEEDQKLKAAGLLKTMPSDWDGSNPLDRYNAVGIKVLNTAYIDAVKAYNKSISRIKKR
jgi:hypothetical protein